MRALKVAWLCNLIVWYIASSFFSLKRCVYCVSCKKFDRFQGSLCDLSYYWLLNGNTFKMKSFLLLSSLLWHFNGNNELCKFIVMFLWVTYVLLYIQRCHNLRYFIDCTDRRFFVKINLVEFLNQNIMMMI